MEMPFVLFRWKSLVGIYPRVNSSGFAGPARNWAQFPHHPLTISGV